MSDNGLELKQIDGLTVKEAAYILRVDPQTVYGWCYHGKIKFFRVFGSIRIAKGAIESAKETT